ncbi:hypothetical protein P12x_002974 [Tundrisphaera lichenicola]|uniref:hypothetical protein n=1 Tax=Tundrisphaera lichenicola TaxID=2029860 RepID=UPI003EBA8CBE
MSTDPGTSMRKAPNRRLRAMLVFIALTLGLYGFVRLDRSTAERLGPVAEGLHHLFNQVPGEPPRFTPAARLLADDVKALGGDPGVNVTKPGYFGTFGQEEWFNVTFHNPEFDDSALARLAEAHGSQIGGLYLENTAVTDAGLKSLGKFTNLRHLSIRNYQIRGQKRNPPITGSGLVHLKGLDHLWTLFLNDIPITDSDLQSLEGLPELMGLYLQNTDIQGSGLAGLKSLSRLHILYLDGCKISDDGLMALSGAKGLRILSLRQVPLSESALPHLKAIPGLEKLDITGCGFLDEEVADLQMSSPKLSIDRK